MVKILFTGGGTGGHIVPLVAVARALRRLIASQDLRLSYMGPKDEFSELLLSQEDIEVFHVAAGKLRRYGGLQNIFLSLVDLFLKIPLGIVQSFVKLFFLAPDIVLSKGGYGALPPVIAAWLLQIPVVLHESDTVPGIANKIAGAFASKIFVSFPKTLSFPPKKMEEVGNPVRKELLSGSAKEAQLLFKLQGEKPVLLVMGGSQGAQRINDMLLVILNEALQEFEIIHQTGEKNFEQVRKEAQVVIQKERMAYYHPFPFLKETDLRHAYSACDLVIGRSGSGFIFETAALGKPSILIPLPEAAQHHQIQNAYAYANTGAAVVLEEANLTPHFFLEKLRSFFANPQELEAMSQKALAFAKPEAAQRIAKALLEYLSK